MLSPHHADEDPHVLAPALRARLAKALRGVSGVLQRGVADLQEEPLLRVHLPRLLGGNLEEERIEAVESVDEAAPLEINRALARRIGIIFLREVPPLAGNLRDAVAAAAQVLPEHAHVRGPRKPTRHADDRYLRVRARGAGDAGELGAGERTKPSAVQGRRPVRAGAILAVGGMRPVCALVPGLRALPADRPIRHALPQAVLAAEVGREVAQISELEEERSRDRPEGLLEDDIQLVHGHRIDPQPVERLRGPDGLGGDLEGTGDDRRKIGLCGGAPRRAVGRRRAVLGPRDLRDRAGHRLQPHAQELGDDGARLVGQHHVEHAFAPARGRHNLAHVGVAPLRRGAKNAYRLGGHGQARVLPRVRSPAKRDRGLHEASQHPGRLGAAVRGPLKHGEGLGRAGPDLRYRPEAVPILGAKPRKPAVDLAPLEHLGEGRVAVDQREEQLLAIP